MKYFFIIFLLFGCQHDNVNINKLDERIDYVEYETINKLCFLKYDICKNSIFNQCNYIYNTCNDSNKICLEQQDSCLTSKVKGCFVEHEKCIIHNYRIFLKIQKRKGREINKPKAEKVH